MGKDKPRGSVLVVGGGIAGIQASLSLADAGYGVYLAEQSESLGGRIPALHRLYPLCACCKLDPRTSACEQDPNIEVMLNTTVESISGELGAFSASVKRQGKRRDLNVGAVVLAGGIETFDPADYGPYGYGQLPNVVTSLEYEQMQKPLGASGGVLKRPSDDQPPKNVAWLQCVGSRGINEGDAPYCSSVCCMYALKEALTTKDLDEDTDTTIFYIDMRTHGKGYEDYLNAAVERGVRLVRSRVHTIEAAPNDPNRLSIAYADETGQIHTETFDMAVLSVGLRPSPSTLQLAEKIGLELDGNHYLHAGPFQPVSTNIPGIYAAGGFSGPNDIAQSLEQAAATVSEIASVLEPVRFSEPFEYPPPSGADQGDPHVLFAYYLCPGMDETIAAEIETVAEQDPTITAVTGLGEDIVGDLTDKIQKTGVNRVVFASCTPVVHRGLVQDALKRAGLNPYVYDTVDLRTIDPNAAAAELRDRIRMGAARASFITAPPLQDIPVVKRALVVGGGLAGMESALGIAREGYEVTLVESAKELGGHARHVRSTWQGHDVQRYLQDLIGSVGDNPKITVMTETHVGDNRGIPGNFVTTLHQNGRTLDVSHGVTVLATGADPVEPKEYLYGEHKNVYLWSELSGKLIEDPSAFEGADTGVFIQCVGSREPQRPHCSRICCTFAVRAALDLKEQNPDMNLYILYRDMRTFGEREDLYREAREKGILFIRYDQENKPAVEPEGDALKVTVQEPIIERPVTLKADFVSLQTAVVPRNDSGLSEIFRTRLDANGFLAESPEKLRPLDTTTEGVFMAGLAAYPKDTTESIIQARGAAARALEILGRDSVQVGGMKAEVMPEKCAACCTCVRTCPFNAPYIDPDQGAAYIDPGLCQGCGICVAECPAKAIVMSICSDAMLTAAPSILLEQS